MLLRCRRSLFHLPAWFSEYCRAGGGHQQQHHVNDYLHDIAVGRSQPLVRLFHTEQHDLAFDEFRKLEGKRPALGRALYETIPSSTADSAAMTGDVPMLVEESALKPTLYDEVCFDRDGGAHGDFGGLLCRDRIPDDRLLRRTALLSALLDAPPEKRQRCFFQHAACGVSPLGMAFDASVDNVIRQANVDAMLAVVQLRDEASAQRQRAISPPSGATVTELWTALGHLPTAMPPTADPLTAFDETLFRLCLRRVWATFEEIHVFDLTVSNDAMPNQVTVINSDGDQVVLYRTTLSWTQVRLLTAFDIGTKMPLSPRLQIAIRRWCIMTNTWWSVWGTEAAFAANGIEVLPRPITIRVLDEWGQDWELVSAYSCKHPEEAIRAVFGSRCIA